MSIQHVFFFFLLFSLLVNSVIAVNTLRLQKVSNTTGIYGIAVVDMVPKPCSKLINP